MTAYAFDWVDAFSDRPFGGNGCLVVHAAAALDDETCKAVVRESGLVECAFLGSSSAADLRVRIFVASKEVPFAGHPTLASVVAYAARHPGVGPDLMVETLAGVIPVRLEADGQVTMTQIAPSFGAEADPAEVAAIYGIAPEEIIGTPQIVSTGLPFTITVLRSHEALRRARLDWPRLEAYCRGMGADDGHTYEPYLVTLRGATEAGDTFARVFFGPPSPPEDPFTGSATGATAAYLWRHGLIDRPRYRAEQGHWMGRPGHAEVEVLGPRDAIRGVRVTGAGYRLMSGELNL